MGTLAFLAQVPGQEQAGDALSNIAGQGILGSLCVLLIVALVVAVRALLKSKDDRFTDQKTMAEALHKLNEAARDLAIEMNSSMTNLVNEAIRSNDSTKSVVTNLEKEQAELRASVNGQKDAQNQTTTVLATLQTEVARLSALRGA